MRRGHPALVAVAVAVAVALAVGTLAASLAAGAGAGPAVAGASGTPTAAASTATTAPTSTPNPAAPVTLQVADQEGLLQALFAVGGRLAGAPYTVQWMTEPSAPAVIDAEAAGSVDVGLVDSATLVFAQANGAAVTAVAATDPPGGGSANCALVVPTRSSAVRTDQLRGRTVAFTPGSVGEYLLARALSQAGLGYGAVIHSVTGPAGAAAALTAGRVDAAVLGQPELAEALAGGTARVLVPGAPLIHGRNFLVASRSALADPGERAAVVDFARRLDAADVTSAEHPAPVAVSWARPRRTGPAGRHGRPRSSSEGQPAGAPGRADHGRHGGTAGERRLRPVARRPSPSPTGHRPGVRPGREPGDRPRVSLRTIRPELPPSVGGGQGGVDGLDPGQKGLAAGVVEGAVGR